MTFKVRIEPSGHEFVVAEGESVLGAALRQGRGLPYSCRGGTCGTCKGDVLSGEVDYGASDPGTLPEAERAAGKALFCQAAPKSDLVIRVREVAAAEGITIRILPCRVTRMERAAPDVMVLELKPPQNERLHYLPGQYLDILLTGGARRSFSIANAPGRDDFLELHVRHVPGGKFSSHVFEGMKEKDLLRFQAPFGTFFLRDESAAPAILVAGGTGFAPIQAILQHAFARDTDRLLHLYWGARSRVDLYRHEQCLAWAREHANFRYTPVLSQPMPGDDWSGRGGFVHEAVLADYVDLSGHEIYASGPPVMIESIRRTFPAQGMDEDRLFFDSFEYAHDKR